MWATYGCTGVEGTWSNANDCEGGEDARPRLALSVGVERSSSGLPVVGATLDDGSSDGDGGTTTRSGRSGCPAWGETTATGVAAGELNREALALGAWVLRRNARKAVDTAAAGAMCTPPTRKAGMAFTSTTRSKPRRRWSR